MAEKEPLLTAEQYQLLPDLGQPTELVRGRIVSFAVSTPRHGQICSAIVYYLGNFAEQRDLGHVCARSAVITERDPDTVRGADVAFYSYSRMPRGPLPPGYLPAPRSWSSRCARRRTAGVMCSPRSWNISMRG